MPEQPPPIPDFTLLRPIGRGAYGEVWLARSVTGVYRAVKIVRRDSFNEDRPFEREFAGIQRFEPVSVGQESQVSLLHVGRNDEAGFFYYVMELADDIETGEEIFPERYVPKTLKELRARRQRLPADECLSISLALTRALAHLHKNALVHRDIKPSNVIFVHGVPKLADIGLVSAMDTSESFVGTEGFVPPEGPGSAAADLFSLGKVIYEISTGRDRHEFPKLPDHLDSLPDRRALLELNEVVLKACDADLERRYASAEVMREELLLLQAGKSVRRLHIMERRFAFVAKYGIAATIITALAVGGFLWAAAQTRQAKENLQRAERAEAAALSRFHEANLNWIRANRRTRLPGQRFDSLAELTKAAARTNSLDLRNEAIACLALPDLRPVRQWAKTPYWDSFNFSPSFRLYGTNDDRGNLTVRDTATDAIRFKLPTQGIPLASAVASADEQFLATSDMMGRAWIWDLGTQAPRKIEFPPNAKLLEFTPDGRSLVIKHADNSLHFLNTTNGVEYKSFPGPDNLGSVRFNRSGELLLALARRHALLLRVADGKMVRQIDLPTDISAAAWHPDGRRAAIAWSARIGLWDVETGRQLGVFEGNEALVVGLAFTDTGEWLASSSWDHATRLWHTDTAREALRMTGAGNTLRFSSDGRHLAFKSWDNSRMHLFESADTRAVQRFTLPAPTRHYGHYLREATSLGDSELVPALDREGVYVFQPPHPAPVAMLPIAEGDTAKFQSGGEALFTSGTNGVKRWPMQWSADRASLRIGPPEVLEPTRGQRVDAFDVSSNGRWLVAKTQTAFLAFDPEKPGETIRAAPSIESGHSPYLSPDGQTAANIAGSRRTRIQIWNARTGMPITNLPVVAAGHLSFSPDGRWLACSADYSGTLWRTADWKARSIPRPPHAEGRYRVTFSPDSRLIASCLSDQATQIAVAETGEELCTLHTERLITNLAFSPGGDRLAVVCEPGYFQLWDLRHLREQLAGMNLDWPEPPLPPGPARTKPVRVTVISNVASATRAVSEKAEVR